MNKKKLIKWLLLIFWLILIFAFSNQPNSGEKTYSIIESLLPNLKTGSLINILNFIIRKSAHFTEYFVLAILFVSLAKEYSANEKKIIISCIIFCFLYACTDEFHQAFVPGRTSLFRDVLIDTSGSLSFLIIYIIYLKKNHKAQKLI